MYITHVDWSYNECVAVVTNNLMDAVHFIRTMRGVKVYVDNEANTQTGLINCCTVMNESKQVLVYYGHNVHVDQFLLYSEMAKKNMISHHWGGNQMEAFYPNKVDV